MLGATTWLFAFVFAGLCAFSLYLALRRDRFQQRQPRSTWVWAAVVSALALGASIGGTLPDGRLAGQLAVSQLERERLAAELDAARASAPTTHTPLPESQAAVPPSTATEPPGEVRPIPVPPAQATAPTPQDLPSPVSPAPAVDLSGPWVLQTITEETTHSPFLGLELTFELTVSETPTGIIATGEKVGERLPGAALRTYALAARTPIALTGTFVEGDLLQVRFTEEGASRTSSGEMVLEPVAEGRFEGSFSSEAGGAAGRVVLERQQAASR